MLIHFEKNSDPIKITFNIIGAAAAAANLLYELSIAEKKRCQTNKKQKWKGDSAQINCKI